MEEEFFNADMLNDRIYVIMEELITYYLPSVKQLIVSKDSGKINVSFDGNSCSKDGMQLVLDKIKLFQSDKNNFNDLCEIKNRVFADLINGGFAIIKTDRGGVHYIDPLSKEADGV